MIISLISQKGGVGKSALSKLIAVEYVNAGWRVKIADLDRNQGSTTNWKQRRDQNEIEPEIPVEKYATVDRALRDAELFDLMILDGPAFAERGGKEMALNSDLVIMPTSYSLDDLEPQVQTAYDLEEVGVDPDKILFVLTLIDGSDSEDKSARDYLRRAGVKTLNEHFPKKTTFRQANNMGLAASEVGIHTLKTKALQLAQAIANHAQQVSKKSKA